MTDYGCIACFSYLYNPSTEPTEILRGAIPTGYRFRKFLVERYGFKLENITMVTDENKPTPAKSYLVQVLSNCVRKLKPDDRFVYLFIGHGGRYPSSYLDSTGFVEYQTCGDDFNGFSTGIEDFTLRHIVERIPNGVYFTMISDTCMSGGILDSAIELYGTSYDVNSSVESHGGPKVRFIADPTSLLDLPPLSGRELGICFTACQTDQTTSGAYNPIAKEYQTSYTQTLMNLAIAYNGKISNYGMAALAHKEYKLSVNNSDQMPGLYGSVDQENLIFLGKEQLFMDPSIYSPLSSDAGPSNSLGIQGYVTGNRVSSFHQGSDGLIGIQSARDSGRAFSVGQLQTILPPNTNIPEAYAHGNSEEQAFIQNLALFFTSFFKVHIRILESTQENITTLLLGLEYLIRISYVDDTEVFKVCLDYWKLFEPHRSLDNPAASANLMGLQVSAMLPGMVDGHSSQLLQRRQLYAGLMSKLRMLMICRMAKSEEVLIVEDENGNIVRETLKDNDVLVQYKIMRETLIYLAHLDHDDTEKQMLMKLSKQLSGEDWTWNNLNTLCWAIGSISGSMIEEQVGENEPFVSELLSGLPITIADLEPHQIHSFYESVAHMIQAESDSQKRDEFLQWLMELPNQKWMEIIGQAHQNVDFLKDQDVIRTVLNILQTNTSVASSLGTFFLPQITMIFLDMLNVYRYKATMIEDVPRIFEAVFQCTLEMITKNFEDYPEHRLKFFSLLRAIATHCFPALICLSSQQLKLVIDSIMWAFRHTERNIAKTGLNLLLEMLKKFQGSEFCNQFYGTYFLTTENEMFAVLTDTFHKPGFKLHVLVLQHLFCLLETGVLTEPLWDVATSSQSYPSNAVFVREYTIKLLSVSFPNMTTAEVTQFVNGLFESTNDLSTFKTHIRDFLIQSKEFSAQDNKDLYAEEAAAQREREQQRMLSIPGLIAPIELQDEMVDS